MEINPFTIKYNKLNSRVDDLVNKKIKLSEELKWFEGINISNLYHEKTNILSLKEANINLLISIDTEIVNWDDKIAKIKASKKSNLNPLNWFDKEQKTNSSMNKILEELIFKKLEYKHSILDKNIDIEKNINELLFNINKYEKCNENTIKKDIDNISKEISLLYDTLNKVAKDKLNMDKILKPLLKQVDEFEEKKIKAKNILNKAIHFDDKLNKGNNSYERALIHEESEKQLGESRPQKIIKQQERIIRQIERDLEKIRKRAVINVEKASREIINIIIDGNNMCYEDNLFVGLAPLIKSTLILQEKYNIILVFDSAIRSQLKSNDNKIKSKFSDKIKIHIVASKQLADETILDISSGNKESYIISNDRFGEYNDKEIVKNKRIIRHEIVHNKVIIHDLNINLNYKT